MIGQWSRAVGATVLYMGAQRCHGNTGGIGYGRPQARAIPPSRQSRCRGFPMNAPADKATWMTVAILVARLIFAGVFIMAAAFKFMGMGDTAGYIAAAGFPMPLLLAWLAALFETALILCLLSGAYFSEAALLAAAYVLFLAFAFHGPA